jgi:hypothetical protein
MTMYNENKIFALGRGNRPSAGEHMTFTALGKIDPETKSGSNYGKLIEEVTI